LVAGIILYGIWDRRLIASSAPFVAEEAVE